MAKDTDRFIVTIPGMTIRRVRDGRVEVFADVGGVEYAGMKLHQVQALEALFARVVDEMVKLGQQQK